MHSCTAARLQQVALARFPPGLSIDCQGPFLLIDSLALGVFSHHTVFINSLLR